MESLTAVFILIAVVFFFWGIAAVFKPGCALFIRTQKRTRGRGIISGLLLALLFFVCAVIAAPQKEQGQNKIAETATPATKTTSTNPEKAPTPSFLDTPAGGKHEQAAVPQGPKQEEPQPAKPQEVRTIGINVTQLAKRVNAALSEVKSPYRMPEKPKIQNGPVNDVVNYQFSEKFSVVITIDKKTKNVISITSIITPSTQNNAENMAMVAADAAIISAFEGKGQLKTVGKRTIEILNKALTAYTETQQDHTESFIFNGKKYTAKVSATLGIITYAELAD